MHLPVYLEFRVDDTVLGLRQERRSSNRVILEEKENVEKVLKVVQYIKHTPEFTVSFVNCPTISYEIKTKRLMVYYTLIQSASV